MDSIEKWVSVLGSIASIGAAIWAWVEASKASTSAKKAEIVKNEIVDRRKLAEVSQVHAETSRVLKTVSKVGPSCNPTMLRGVNCAGIAKEVEEFSRFINEQSSHFTEFFDNKAKELCAALNDDIEALSEAKSFEDKKAAGKSIYYKINDFMPTVKTLSDEKRESITTRFN
ncbi:hypothetical protein [Agarilytica rhodophyticola]|uniref:hypothetical protein n=1 Tax=Agarilytica rhodophyticola TaxID=1737490 RepID=UPI000B342F8E|nr:hypothetical protein [Agarilytica rhodophyticola]